MDLRLLCVGVLVIDTLEIGLVFRRILVPAAVVNHKLPLGFRRVLGKVCHDLHHHAFILSDIITVVECNNYSTDHDRSNERDSYSSLDATDSSVSRSFEEGLDIALINAALPGGLSRYIHSARESVARFKGELVAVDSELVHCERH
jgi:hypothetical protein